MSSLSPSTKLVGTWRCESTDFEGASYDQVFRRNGTFYTFGRMVKKDSIQGKPFDIVYTFKNSGEWTLNRNNVLEMTKKDASMKNVTDVPGLSYQQNLEARKIIDSELNMFDEIDDSDTHFFELTFKDDSNLTSRSEGGGNNESCSRLS